MRNSKTKLSRKTAVGNGLLNLSGNFIKSFTFFFIAVWLVGCSNLSNVQTASSPPPMPIRTDPAKENEVRFENAKSRFTALPEKVQLTNKPYIKGKAAYYQQEESNNQAGWWLKNDLGTGSSFTLVKKDQDVNGILAQSPSEVQTVILRPLKCEKIRIGSYKVENTDEKLPGFAESCELTIVDLTIPAIIYRKKLQAYFSEWDSETQYGKKTEVFKRLENYEIYEYLKSLPRK